MNSAGSGGGASRRWRRCTVISAFASRASSDPTRRFACRRICSRAAWAEDRRPCAKRCARSADLAVVDEGGREALARQILDLFATFAQVRQGAVFLAAEPDTPLPAKATAALGAAPELSDPIVEEALRQRELVAFDSAVVATKAGARPGTVVLAVPLEDVEGQRWGVLAVSDLPFSAYGAEARARIAALAGHVADLLACGAPRRLAGPHHEESVDGFTRRLRRAAHDRRTHGIASGVVQFSLEGNRAPALAAAIVRQRRVTDAVLTSRRRDGRETVTLLLPMTDDIGVARYLGRVETVVREATGVALREAGVKIVAHVGIDASDRYRGPRSE